jgi:hypothetical protein
MPDGMGMKERLDGDGEFSRFILVKGDGTIGREWKWIFCLNSWGQLAKLFFNIFLYNTLMYFTLQLPMFG